MIGGLAVTAVTGVVVLVLTLGGSPAGQPRGWANVGSVDGFPIGTVEHFSDLGFFLVGTDEGYLALIDKSTHLGNTVAYCESSGWFFEPAHGEKWDGSGVYRLGPAPRGLDRHPVRVRTGEVEVLIDEVILGPPRGTPGERRPRGPFCVDAGHGTS